MDKIPVELQRKIFSIANGDTQKALLATSKSTRDMGQPFLDDIRDKSAVFKIMTAFIDFVDSVLKSLGPHQKLLINMDAYKELLGRHYDMVFMGDPHRGVYKRYTVTTGITNIKTYSSQEDMLRGVMNQFKLGSRQNHYWGSILMTVKDATAAPTPSMTKKLGNLMVTKLERPIVKAFGNLKKSKYFKSKEHAMHHIYHGLPDHGRLVFDFHMSYEGGGKKVSFVVGFIPAYWASSPGISWDTPSWDAGKRNLFRRVWDNIDTGIE